MIQEPLQFSKVPERHRFNQLRWNYDMDFLGKLRRRFVDVRRSGRKRANGSRRSLLICRGEWRRRDEAVLTCASRRSKRSGGCRRLKVCTNLYRQFRTEPTECPHERGLDTGVGFATRS